MISLIQKSKATFFALFVTVSFLILLAVMAVSTVTHADNGVSPHGGRLITIHDRGTEKAILSQASTIGDAVKEAGITLDSKDVVEPAADSKLVAPDYQVNIYRARPVIIVDGNIRQKTITAYQTAEQIAKSAGIVVYPEDRTTLGITDGIADGVGVQLTIERATPFVFNLHGKTSTVRAMGGTVGEMLSEKGIRLSKDDRVLPSQNTKLTNGLVVRVWREGKQTITVDEVVQFTTDQTKDADRDVGYVNITNPGVSGMRSVSYEVVVQDGQEVSRSEIASIITKQPVKQTEVVGAKGEYTTPSENETITWDFLTANGFSRYQAAGIMGNLMQEHGFNTSDTSGGYGLVQWTGGRRSELLSWAYPENIYTQLNFLMHELSGGYGGVRDAILSQSTIDGSMYVFQNQFERCGVCVSGQRLQYAYNILASH